MRIRLENTIDSDTELKILDEVQIDEYVDMTSDISLVSDSDLYTYDLEWIKDIKDIDTATDDVNTMLMHLAMGIRLRDFMDKEYPNYKPVVINADFIESGIHITGTLALFSDGGRLNF